MLFTSLFLSLWTGIIAPVLATNALSTALTDKVAAKTEEIASTEKLTWSDARRLTWNDFKANPDSDVPHHALTAANLTVDAKFSGNNFSYDVKCVFLPEQSWSKNKKSESLLQHEQLHFDLTEVHARQLRKKLEKLDRNSNNLKENLNTTVAAAFKEWKEEQSLFDKSCNHGLNKQEEAAWAQNINQRLHDLQAYK